MPKFDLNAYEVAFEYFDEYRTYANVYGAPRDFAEEFDEPKANARALFKAWTATFGDGSTPVEERAKAAYDAAQEVSAA